jgi:large subunit ribosomal protein L13
MNRTTTARPDNIERTWHLVDATNVPVGRLAAQVAQVLRGKHKPTFTPHMDCGDFVVIINASKAVWTGTKGKELMYHHSGFPGGLTSVSRGDFLEDNPEKLLERVIWGMLPKGALGKDTIKKLKVYAGSEHPHSAQSPKPLDIGKK